jgi:hypothetical protein
MLVGSGCALVAIAAESTALYDSRIPLVVLNTKSRRKFKWYLSFMMNMATFTKRHVMKWKPIILHTV